MAESVTDHAERSRFEISEDGELAGFAEYRRHGDRIVITHTETDPRFRGHGVAGRLIAASLDQARKEGLAVVPVCPFARDWIASHPDYADLVPDKRREEFGL